MQLWAKWSIAGVITDARTLTSQKNKDWRGYILKVATLGQTFELGVEAEQYQAVAAGELHEFRGHWEEQRGDKGVFLKLIVDDIREVGSDEATDKPATAGKVGAA